MYKTGMAVMVRNQSGWPFPLGCSLWCVQGGCSPAGLWLLQRSVPSDAPCDVMLGFLVLPNKHPGPLLSADCAMLYKHEVWVENPELGH